MRKKFTKFEERYFSPTTDEQKLKLLKEYCKKNDILLLMFAANIPEDALNNFKKFLEENQILVEE